GQRVLIHGAGGGVGTFTVQIAKVLGAHVTAVTRTENVELILSIGADDVIDYTKQDFTGLGRRFDILVDNGGSRSLADCRRVMTADGTLIMVGAPPGVGILVGRLLAAALRTRLGRQ